MRSRSSASSPEASVLKGIEMAKIPLVDLKAQYASIKDEIDAAMQRVVSNTAFIGGKEVSDFEAAFARFQQTLIERVKIS